MKASLGLLIVAAIALACVFGIVLMGGSESSPEDDIAVAPVATKYVVRAYEGKIAVFLGDSAVPAIVYEIEVAMFPPEDVALLMAGITVSGDNELRALLEDYLG